jgi:hypothetical protein
MASRKSYAYQMKGQKLGLIENKFGFGSGQDSITVGGDGSIGHKQHTLDEIGPTGTPSWVSPDSSVIDGLEIEYTYMPDHNLTGADTFDVDLFRFLGWGSDGTNLVFFVSDNTANPKDLTSKFTAGDKIHVEGSGRWAGVHEVKDRTNKGVLTTTTLYRETSPSVNKMNDITCNITRQGNYDYINAADASAVATINAFYSFVSLNTFYIFVTDAANDDNDGFFEVNDDLRANGIFKFTKELHVATDSSFPTVTETTIIKDYVVGAISDHIDIYYANYEPMWIRKGVDQMVDEEFDLDINRTQAMAIEMYLQSKKFETAGNLELKVYYYNEFLKYLERDSNSKQSGPRRVQGFGMMR